MWLQQLLRSLMIQSLCYSRQPLNNSSNHWTHICLLRIVEHLVAPISKCSPERRISLPWGAAEITYNTKLMLPKATIENRIELSDMYKASSSFSRATSKVYIQGPKLPLCIQKQGLPKPMTEGCACSEQTLTWIQHRYTISNHSSYKLKHG